MSQEFILRLAHMAHSRPPSRAHRRYHSASLASTQDGKIRARRPRATGPIEINGEEEDGGDDVDVEMKVDSWDHTNENTAATKQLDPITARQFQNSCVECQDMPCRRHVFSFMSLPTEIRLQIYRLALARDTPVLLHIAKPKAVKQEETPDEELMHCTRGAAQRARGMRVLSQVDYSKDCNTDVDRRGPPHENSLITALLLVSRQVHSEARPVLYSENNFVLQLESAVCTLTKLRQQSRSLIKHVSLTVPSHHHVLEGFADLVRLGLRYCWGLQTFTIALPTFLPRDREVGSNGTNVYANAFHILRWLPQTTKVILDGGATHDIRQVVEENMRMAKDLDNTSYLKRQHQMPERV